MREIPIHFYAILAAALAKMAIGALWYSPALFNFSSRHGRHPGCLGLRSLRKKKIIEGRLP
jgi:hypothetical protein